MFDRRHPNPDLPCRVLIVDADPLLRWSITETLQLGPYLVDEAESASAMMAAVWEADYDVLIVDADLAGRDGLARLTAHVGKRAWIMAMLGLPTRTSIDAAFAQGAKVLLEKPFSMTTLRQSLDAGVAFRCAA